MYCNEESVCLFVQNKSKKTLRYAQVTQETIFFFV